MTSTFSSQYSQPFLNANSKSLQLAQHFMDKTNMAAKFSRRFEQLLRSEKYYDCVFHIGSIQYKCHKLILSTASPVFEAMFYGPLCEQQQEIEILDISPDIFKVFIHYIYAGVLDFESFTLDETIELYYCSEKYLVAELATSCLLAITRKLRYANILPALELCVCLELCDLLEVCMSFFSRCCLNNPQFMTYHKHHYLHVSKECIKAIISANKAEKTSKQLLWFIYEWCQQECLELGLPQADYSLIVKDLQLPKNSIDGGDLMRSQKYQSYQSQQCNTIERSYYKACRPFTINESANQWTLFVKCNRFIALHGLIMSSRLAPNFSPLTHYAFNLPSDYSENLRIEITAPSQSLPVHPDNSNNNNNGQAADDLLPLDTIVWQHTVVKQFTKYNCDLNIDWGEGLLLTPDVEYCIKLIWRAEAYGSEYPCSLQSDFVDGIQFRDHPVHSGSPIKGLRYLNLV